VHCRSRQGKTDFPTPPVSNALKLAPLHDTFVLLALALDAVLMFAVAVVWKLAHNLVCTISGIAVRKAGAQSNPLSGLVSVGHNTSV
jgi:hypothetical protein